MVRLVLCILVVLAGSSILGLLGGLDMPRPLLLLGSVPVILIAGLILMPELERIRRNSRRRRAAR